MILGAAFAILYICIIFGPGHRENEPPRHCAITVEPRGWPIRVRQGSIYIHDYRIHHWLIYLVILPFAIWLRVYALLGWVLVFVVHGLWFKDRCVFRDEHAHLQCDKQEETVHLGALTTEEDSEIGRPLEANEEAPAMNKETGDTPE